MPHWAALPFGVLPQITGMAERPRIAGSHSLAFRGGWLRSLLALLLTVGLAFPLLHHGAAGAGDGRSTLRGGAAELQPPAMQPRPVVRRDLYSRLEPIPSALAAAPQIRLGVHLENAYNLSIPDQTFMADGWYWLEWPEAVQQRIEAEKIDPDQMVELVNNIIGYDFNVEPDNPEPIERADGSHYQLFRFSGSFYIDDLNLRRSPFNQLSLPLLFETRPQSFATDGKQPVLLVPEPNKDGLLGAYVSIKGYQEVGVNIQPLIHSYPTDFGDRSTHDFAMTELRVFYRIPWFTAFLQWVMPLLIVMAVVFLAPSLEGSLGELRLAIPSTALLTLVVMQQTYQAELPPLPYLTFLDVLYGYCYFISIALFVLFVWGTNVHAAAEGDSTPEAAAALRQRIDRADRRFQVISLIGMAVVLVLAYLF
jgi:hypothetical protein